MPHDIVDIMVDSNRDGWVDTKDNEGEAVWDNLHGAAFLPNLDDDNLDGIRDAETPFMDIAPDNNADLFDLAPLLVRAWPEAPDGAIGWLTLSDGLSLPHVRVFKLLPDLSWQLVIGADACAPGVPDCLPHAVPLRTEEIRAGVEFRVEGRTLAGLWTAVSPDPNNPSQMVPWDGFAELKWEIFEAGAAAPLLNVDDDSAACVDAWDKGEADRQKPGVCTVRADVVRMRVAPWMNLGTMVPGIDTIYSNVVSNVFVQGIEVATVDAGVNYNKIPSSSWNDHWTEDWMQTGWVSVPAPANDNGEPQVHGMRLAMPRPWGRTGTDKGLPVNWLMKPAPAGHLGWDYGYMVVYREPHSGSSYDSHGNHDLMPPYSYNGQDFPYGRIIHGTGILDETHAFYNAQIVQGPALEVKTSWLIVGHVDEVLSYAPAKNERGWKFFVGMPKLAVEMLQKWQKEGYGSEPMFVGKKWSNGKSAQVTIDQVLADPDVMAASQEAQAETDGIVAQLKAELGVTDEDLVPIPYLYEEDYNALVAYNPGTANVRMFNDGYVVLPDPFGPKINGVDGFKQDLIDRLGTAFHGLGYEGQGLKVYFTDDWDMYHRLLGEVHCGSNYDAPPVKRYNWWEAMQ